MMAKRGLLLGPLFVALFLVVACGDDGGGSVSLDVYFQRLEELDQTFSDNTDELDNQIEQSEDVDEVRGWMEETVTEFETFLDGLRDLDAPEEAADAHERAVSGLEEFIPKLSEGVDSVSDVDSLVELFAPFNDLDQTGLERAREACLDLEQIALDNDIEVDLDCGSGDEIDDETPTGGEPTDEAPTDVAPSGDLEDYFEELDAAEDIYRIGNDAVAQQLNLLDDSTVDQAVNLVLDGQEGIDTFLDALESMDPPPEVEAAHEETVAGFQAASEWIDENMVEFAEATTIAEVNAIFGSPEFGEISNSLDGTCDALQGIAEEYGIFVDLGC
jgi:hypothetical protein